MRNIKAKFIGENGSLGFINGRIYTINIELNTLYTIGEERELFCPYSSVESFLKNWELI